MNKARRTNQGGSIATFVIVGVILAVVLVGGIYALGQHGRQVRKDQAIATVAQQQTTNTPIESDNSEVVTSGNSKTSSSSAKTSQNLPVTGPELSISELIAVFLLAMTVTSYLSSRRDLVRYLGQYSNRL
jgi:predicted lysophospholipase L1 biosynthesis ABC-type transport system permease subunit